MKNFSMKEGSTWAGVAIVLGNVAGALAGAGLVKPAAVVSAISAICGAIAGYIPDNKSMTIK